MKTSVYCFDSVTLIQPAGKRPDKSFDFQNGHSCQDIHRGISELDDLIRRKRLIHRKIRKNLPVLFRQRGERLSGAVGRTFGRFGACGLSGPFPVRPTGAVLPGLPVLPSVAADTCFSGSPESLPRFCCGFFGFANATGAGAAVSGAADSFSVIASASPAESSSARGVRCPCFLASSA